MPELPNCSRKQELYRHLEDRKRQRSLRYIDRFYRDTGPLRRELYPDHTDFFRAGAKFPERMMMAANRIGKTA